jgi:leucyl aminopeptidase
MPTLTLKSTPTADALVVAVKNTADGPRPVAPGLPEELRTALTESLTAIRFEAKPESTTRLPAPTGPAPVVVATGIAEDFDAEAVRRSIGAGVATLTGFDIVAVAPPASDAASVRATAEGAGFGAYVFSSHKSTTQTGPANIAVAAPASSANKAAIETAQILVDAVHAVRDLVNTGPNTLYPAALAEIAKAAVKGTGIRVKIWTDSQLADDGFGGLTAVGQGSIHPPRMVRLTWSPTRAKGHVALVGKGITFDSGGLSIKPAKAMETMKSDMAGAATVLHTIIAAAKLQIPLKVTAFLALAENMPSATAMRPSDVITIRGGTTVEVLNTDAEGRLVLADALVAATEVKPDAILDVATLTGAQIVALGTRVAGVMGTDEVRAEVVDAAGRCGEQMWPMPLPPELRSSLDSKVANISNMGDRNGGMLVGGLFLKEFVADVPWAHLDIAGPSFNESSRHGYTPPGGTGMGVRTLVEFLSGRAGR